MEAEPIKFYLIALCAVLAVGFSQSGHAKKVKKKEKHYQAEWCAGKGKTEHVLPDRTRVDCLTDNHAIEFDWGKKWHEGIGQSWVHLHKGTEPTIGFCYITAIASL